MKTVQNLKTVEWITKHLEQHKDDRPFCLKNFLPSIFEYYIVKLWTPGIIDSFPFEEYIIDPDDIDRIEKNLALLKKHNLLVHRWDNESIFRITNFQELSKRFNKIYNLHIPKTLDWSKPGIRHLWNKTRDNICEIIKSISPNTHLNLFVSDMWKWDSSVNGVVLYTLTIEEYHKFMDETQYDSSSYLFPDDLSYCLLNFKDLAYSIIAFNENIHKIIIDLNLIDSFEINPDFILSE